jgi:hypothetical protein
MLTPTSVRPAWIQKEIEMYRKTRQTHEQVYRQTAYQRESQTDNQRYKQRLMIRYNQTEVQTDRYRKTDNRRYRYSLQTVLVKQTGRRQKERQAYPVGTVQSNRHCYNQTYKKGVCQTDEQCRFQMPKDNKN